MPRLAVPPSCLLALASFVPAQGGAPTFVPKAHLVRMCAEDVPKLLEQLPQSGVGKLLADPEVAAAWSAGLRRYRERADRTAALVAAISTLDIPIEPWIASQLPLFDGFAAVRTIDLGDLRRFEIAAVLDPENPQRPRSLILAQCSPRAEGRWTGAFEKRAETLRQSKTWQALPETKFAGFPAHGFEI